MAWVVDCSFAAALGLPDEHSVRVEAFFLQEGAALEIWIPPLWWYELSNVLLMAQRRKRISQADRAALLSRFGSLPLITDTLIGEMTASRIQDIAEQYGLTSYDAAYMELAQRKGAGLATFDRQLAEAARQSGVAVISG